MNTLQRVWSRVLPAWWRREHSALGAAFLVQVILAAVILWPRPVSRAEAGPLLEGFKPEDVTRITLRDAQGTSLILERQGDWVLAGTDGFAAKAETVNDFLNKLAGVRANRLVARTEVSQRQLRVAEDAYEREVTLETASGAAYTVYLGTSPGYGVTHIRLKGQAETYLTDALTVWNAGVAPSSWVDTAYVSIPQEEAKRIAFRNAQGEFALVKGAENKWILEDLAPTEVLNEPLANSLASRALSLYLMRPLGKAPKAEYGLDQPQGTVAIEAGEKSLTLSIGQRLEDGCYVVKSSASPYYVCASEYTVQDFLQKTRADLLQPPATPTPASEGK